MREEPLLTLLEPEEVILTLIEEEKHAEAKDKDRANRRGEER